MFKIVSKRNLNPTVTMMDIEAPLVAKKAEAGQFIILRTDEDGERIPLTVAGFDREKGTVKIIFQIVGATTEKLNHKSVGDCLADFAGPLGKPTETEGLRKVCVVGGGVGCAIALPIAEKLHAEGCGTGMAHMLNSAGLLKYPEYAMDGVRVGSAILGRVSVRGNWGLARIGECQATVEELRWLPKGHSCGYGAGWTAKKPTRVAVFSVGWYHGFGVEMGNDLFRFRDCLRGILRNLKQMIFKKHLYVTVNGKKCRVLGHIGMLHTCVDVTNLPCAVGDTAVFDIKPLLLKGIEVVYR